MRVKPSIQSAVWQLERLIEQHECTRGMSVKARGNSVTLLRDESFGAGQAAELDPKVRFTELSRNCFTLSICNARGGWDPTPFTGTLAELLEMVARTMPYIVAAWTTPAQPPTDQSKSS